VKARRLAIAGQIGALLFLGCGSFAIAADDAKPAPANAGHDTRLDEVLVTGKLDSLIGIRQALIASENRFNARYNELNQDDDYDVVCRQNTPLGTHIPQRLCQPNIVDKEAAVEAEEFFRSINTGGPGTPLTSPERLRIESMHELKKRTLALVNIDPQLKQELVEHSRLEQRYKQMLKRKFGKRFAAGK
jgi:hypothetical protein